MDGACFIGFLWAAWIMATFFLHKQNPKRLSAAFFSLILLISFPYSITVSSFSIKLPALIFLIAGYYYVSKLSFTRKMYMFFSVLIVTSGFAGILLMEIYDPIWIFMDRRILFGAGVFLLGQALYSGSLYKCLVCILIGTIQGEMLFSLFLLKWDIHIEIAPYSFMDILSVSMLLTFSWHFLNQISSYMSIRQTIKNEKQG